MVKLLDYFSQDYLDDKRVICEFRDNSFYRIRSSDYYLGELENIWFDSLSWKIKYVEVSGFKGIEKDESVLVSTQKITQLRNYSNTLCINLKASELPLECTKLPLDQDHRSSKRNIIKGMIKQDQSLVNANYNTDYFASNSKQIFSEGSWNHKNMEALNVEDLKQLSLKTQDGVELDISDVLVNFSKWNVAFMVIEVPYWFSTRKVVCPVSFVNHVNISNLEARVNLDFEVIKSAPSFDFSFFTRAYEIMILDYFINYLELDNPNYANVGFSSVKEIHS